MLKTRENFKLLAQKVVAVAVEGWSRIGSKYSDLTWKLMVFWKQCPAAVQGLKWTKCPAV